MALFIVATTGEGDPPDPAARFVRTVMRSPVSATGLRYGVLALGDRRFVRFCAFGDAVDGWLAQRDATRMFDAIRVHNGDPEALALWWQRLSEITGQTFASPPEPLALPPWIIANRTTANPGNNANAAFYVSLRPTADLPHWAAGDIAVVSPRNDPAEVAELIERLALDGQMQLDGPRGSQSLVDHLGASVLPQTDAEVNEWTRLSPQLLVKSLQPLPAREYSIASIPEDGTVDLLVRQTQRPNGRLGLASGWLTQHAPLGAMVDGMVRANTAFHPPDPQRPMILIGNGTGIAGLRAHLKARAEAGATRNWLIFGERMAASDFFYRDEIYKWRIGRVLERTDFAFSRDDPQRRYVQDYVRLRADGIREWVGDGAAIYVCGSLRGMSTAVNDALVDILGVEKFAQMLDVGLYRRDVY
jgi:sulfite reductase (NADPH) flavoprotein alpha-component